ncbi:MraY family glycosyltransferase [Schaalia canis]|uniref:Undecaprenyl/decaprenyl-phosphate alpha-N-acetylglucosaminyl 1-phosphate transferase n=1 Tax=Schaalia canis TaxID=100469 RepID=A0A3P1SD42_9ACTO|nr:MraY family glycosyltransferase [Schaalia canis]RRC94887.1 undecaprenyl/decaprenyl-phosphate alpha-N-acetylglucosaminyl 1-phosphate transferase [Schaalia canis]
MKVYLLLMLLAMGITVLVTPIVRFACLHWGIVPKLRSRDIQSIPIPRLGGIAMTIGFLIAMLIASTIPYMAPVFSTSVPWAVMGGAAAMSVLGVVDDVIELDWLTKLSGQILITGLMALSGVQLVSFPIFGITIGSSRLSLVLTLLVVVAIINAVNFIDGLDGLAAGTVGIGAMSFFIYSYSLSVKAGAATYATTASLVVITLVGVCGGFLWFNFHPSSIMMGGGAETLGLILASAAIIVTGQIDPSVLGDQQLLVGLLPVLLPLSVIVVPMGDLIATSLIRLKNGKSPFHADRSHFHDRLLARGHGHRGVVAILWLWTAQVSLSAVALLNYPWHRVALVSLPTLVVVLILTIAEFPWMREAARKAAAHGKDGHERHPHE